MINEQKEQEAEVSKTAAKTKKKPVIQVLSALPVGFDGKAKGGGVAPGILNSIPATHEMVRWVGIMKSEGATEDQKKEASLKKYGVKQGIDKEEGTTQTFQNHYVEPKKFWQYYVNATNGSIWPLIHSMPEKKSRKANFESLKSIDEEYSQKLMGIMEDLLAERNEGLQEGEPKETLDDLTVWAHDYHVFHVPGMIKDLAEKSELEGSPKVSFFHHEPWPEISPDSGPSILDQFKKTLTNLAGGQAEDTVVYANFNKTDKEQFKEILTNLTKADTLGFHTEGDAEGFLATVKNFDVLNQAQLQDLSNRVFVNPIGVPKAVMQQNFLLRAPFLKQGLETDNKLNQELGAPQPLPKKEQQEGGDQKVSDVRKVTDDFAVEYRDQQKKAVKEFGEKIEELKEKDSPTRNETQMIKAGPGIIDRMNDGGATFLDKMTVSEQVYFDPEKTQINSVQRFDYTKGIAEFLEGYRDFLRELKAQGVENPEQKYQFNLVTGKGRSGDAVHEYTQYEIEAKILLEAVNKEFPGSIYHFKSGIPNPELPIANAASDILLVSSVADGYVLAGPEILESQIISLEEKMQKSNYNPQVIVTDSVGLARDLETMENKPDRLQLVPPTPESFTRALMKAHENRKQGKGVGLATVEKELKQISKAIPDSMGTFGKVAFAAMEAAPGTARQVAADVRNEHQAIRDIPTKAEVKNAKNRANKQRKKRAKARKAVTGQSSTANLAGLGSSTGSSSQSASQRVSKAEPRAKKGTQAKVRRG